MLATQQNAPLAIESALGSDKLQLRSFSWTEALGQPYEGRLDLVSVDAKIDLQKALKTPIAVRIDRMDGGSEWLHGFVSRFENLGPDQSLTRYRATVVPCFALLKNSGGCRIFQEFTTLDIVKKIFSEFGFSGQLEASLTGVYAKRSYCVQYCESDFDFLTRLLQEEGIYYYFEYSKEKHCMVLADDIHAHSKAKGNESVEYRTTSNTKLDEYLTGYAASHQFATGCVELADYDFEKPRTKLNAKQMSSTSDTKWAWYEYPGDFVESDRGQALAKIRQQATDAAATWSTLTGTARALRCGNVFKLTSHPENKNNIEYLISEATITGSLAGQQNNEDGDFRYGIQITVQPSKLPFRNTPPITRKMMPGPQVATVCGKKGEEIWTDKYGRIKVQFPWDRDGKSDEHSSCWIRVVQPWTGKNWGAISIPRIGEEVVVEFLDGDPDRPIVVGRVYNADMMPPEALAAAQAKTIFRTRSTLSGDTNTFHELSFDDTKDKELIYLHSERDFKRVVENNDETLIGFEKKTQGDSTLKIFNDALIEVGIGSEKGSQKTKIQQDRTIDILKGNDSLTVAEGNATTKIEKGDLSITVAAGNTTIDSAKSIVLKCGESTITIKPSEIVLSSAKITATAQGALSLQGANTTVKASGNLNVQGTISNVKSDGPLNLKGAVVKIN